MKVWVWCILTAERGWQPIVTEWSVKESTVLSFRSREHAEEYRHLAQAATRIFKTVVELREFEDTGEVLERLTPPSGGPN